MNHSDKDQLLKETLAGDELNDFRRASLECTLAAVAQQRRRRRLTRNGTLAALPLLLAFAVAYFHSPSAPKRIVQQVDQAKKEPAAVLAQNHASAVKVISDEELFAMFPDRAMALVGQPGRQELVFLDAGVNAEGHDQK